jgi:hypothetical protein
MFLDYVETDHTTNTVGYQFQVLSVMCGYTGSHGWVRRMENAREIICLGAKRYFSDEEVYRVLPFFWFVVATHSSIEQFTQFHGFY